MKVEIGDTVRCIRPVPKRLRFGRGYVVENFHDDLTGKPTDTFRNDGSVRLVVKEDTGKLFPHAAKRFVNINLN